MKEADRHFLKIHALLSNAVLSNSARGQGTGAVHKLVWRVQKLTLGRCLQTLQLIMFRLWALAALSERLPVFQRESYYAGLSEWRLHPYKYSYAALWCFLLRWHMFKPDRHTYCPLPFFFSCFWTSEPWIQFLAFEVPFLEWKPSEAKCLKCEVYYQQIWTHLYKHKHKLAFSLATSFLLTVNLLGQI